MNETKLIELLMCFLFFALPSNSISSNNTDWLSFPDDFSFGAATSAYQVEGAWNHSDKSVSNWDYYVHKYPNKTSDLTNGDVACDSFHKYKEDVQLLKSLGANHYRFSLSWSRLLPTGYANKVSKSGVEYYHNLLDELSKYNIIPVVTIYHYDNPQELIEKFGGWLSESMIYAFVDYARFVFKEFGHRIKYFVTFNEIFIMCKLGYGHGSHAPGYILNNTGEYVCAHNALKAHALAYRIYNLEFRKRQNGLIGIAELYPAIYSKNNTDPLAEDIGYAFFARWILDPIFSAKGNYPELMISRVAYRSRLLGLKKTRLPVFSKYWIDCIRGSADFLGLNHYTSFLVERQSEENILEWKNDMGLSISSDPSWPTTEFPRFLIHPKGFGDVLRKIKIDYNDPVILVLENGVAVPQGINDTSREEFLYSYMKEMIIAMNRDKCKVKMFTYWSLLDSFEWGQGTRLHFGLAKVDHNSSNRTRTMKNSARWFRFIIESRKLQLPTSLI